MKEGVMRFGRQKILETALLYLTHLKEIGVIDALVTSCGRQTA